MPPKWTRSCYSDRVEHSHRNKKTSLNKRKVNSLDEVTLLPHTHMGNRQSLEAASVYSKGSSVFWDSDSEIGSKAAEKTAYPLPEPLGSCKPSMEFDERVAGFSAETFSLSGPASSESSSNDNDVGCSGDSDSFRTLGKTKWNAWLRTSCHGQQQLWEAGLESPDKKHPCHPLPLPPSTPTGPSQHSKWKKGKLLGRGAFGHVYAGFNSENGQMCAIKEVAVTYDDQSSKECLKQLNQEIALLSELSHPNIVQYYGSKLEEDRLSVYLEYVSGGSIYKLLREYGAFEEPVIQSYTRQILSGLAYLHGRNTVHRDIKGANILVDPNGEIKLADFGMAKHITTCSSVLSFKGSPYWMAPEVIMNTRGHSLAVDIWSLGCTVLEMATSKPPWSQYEGVAAMFKIANSKDFPEIPIHLSEDAQDFIKLCLNRNPSGRPTAVQLLQHPFIKEKKKENFLRVLSADGASSTPRGRRDTARSYLFMTSMF